MMRSPNDGVPLEAPQAQTGVGGARPPDGEQRTRKIKRETCDGMRGGGTVVQIDLDLDIPYRSPIKIYKLQAP